MHWILSHHVLPSPYTEMESWKTMISLVYQLAVRDILIATSNIKYWWRLRKIDSASLFSKKLNFKAMPYAICYKYIGILLESQLIIELAYKSYRNTLQKSRRHFFN